MKCAGARSAGFSLPVHFVCVPRKRCVLRLRAALVGVVVTIGVIPPLYAQSNCNNGTVVVDPRSNPDLVADCQALLRAKSAWNNPAVLEWETSESISSWTGVRVEKGRVSRLFLGDKGLTGVIPGSIESLTGLSELYLTRNDLEGSIPDLSSLESLTVLALGGNSKLKGSFPTWLTDFDGLVGLYLWGTNVEGDLPNWLTQLTNLKALSLSSNPDLSGDITPWLSNLRGVSRLQLFNTKITGCVPRETMSSNPWYYHPGDLLYCDQGPGKPAPPVVRSVTSYGMTVGWMAPVSTGGTITGYDIEYRRDGTPSYARRRVSGAVTSTTISGLSSSTTYEVRFRASNTDGDGPWSESSTGMTEPPPPPTRPGRVSTPTVSGDGWESIKVSWARPWSGRATITDYDVQYREEGTTGAFVDAGYHGTATEARISGLTTGTSYEVQVRARNRVGYGSWSASGVGTAAVRVEFGAPAYTAVEGGAGAAVTVALNEAAIRAVTVPIEVTAGALTEATDYGVSGLGNGAVTFAVGESSRTVTVTAHVDADSADEQVDLTLGTLPAGVTGGATATTEVTLSDKDPLTVRLIGPAGLQEGPFDVAVVFSEEVTGFDAADVTVNDSTVTVTGSGADYVATITPSFSGTVTVQVGAGAVQDNAMNSNEASEPYTVEVQRTCLTGIAVADPANTPGLVLDCTVLLGLKDRLAGTTALNWSAEERMASWSRVTIGATSNRVISVDLNRWDLDGVVPAELGELSELFVLDLSHNGLTGGIPSELSNLDKLFTLRLDHNELDGSIPVELGGMNQLAELRLAHNNLSGSIPAELGSIPFISDLYLNDNELSGDFPSELQGASYLRTLEVQNNRLTGCVPAALKEGLTSHDLGDLQSCADGPGRAGAPEVTPVGTTRLRVRWSEPVNTGSAIGDYDVRYREVRAPGEPEAEFADAEYDGTTTETTIVGLARGASYEVQVRAASADGTGSWSESGLGETSTVTVEFGSSSYVASEGGAAQAVTVRLNMAALEEVLVPIEVNAGAHTEATDYTPSMVGTLTFAVGETGKTIEVRALEDDDDSAEETVELSFGESLTGAGPGAVAAAVVTLADNDPLTVELTGPAGPVNGPFEVTIGFTEEVTGFEPGEVTVTGGTVELAGSGAEYTAKVTPDGAAVVTVDVAAGWWRTTPAAAATRRRSSSAWRWSTTVRAAWRCANRRPTRMRWRTARCCWRRATNWRARRR